MVTTKFHESNEPWKIVSSSSSTCLFLIFFFFFSFRYFYKFCIFHLRIPSYFTFFFLPIFGSLKEFKFSNFFLNDEIGWKTVSSSFLFLFVPFRLKFHIFYILCIHVFLLHLLLFLSSFYFHSNFRFLSTFLVLRPSVFPFVQTSSLEDRVEI